jgi:superfamily II DNA or RNA helicase
VPTISLSTQWEKEITQKFNFQELTICSSLNNQWEDEIRGYGRNLRLGNDVNFCILTTYATFRGKRFQKLFEEMFNSHMAKITMVADEAHTLGSKALLKVLPNLIEKRIGLSATPERQYDEEGEDELFRYFDSFAPNFCFTYNMKEAIDNRVLCRYYYYPVLVDLTQEELVAYKEISNKLSKFLDPNTGKYKDDPYVNNLLIRRKNIIHKAKNKAKCLINIIDDIGKEKFKYAFIYVPEGFEQNFEEEDNPSSNDDDDRIIQEYTDLLYQRYKFKLRKFTGDTNDRDQILTQFSEGKLDALLAMKCLDEGVDVPQTQYAIFCSSTGNPRQYIQRRGRVLRYHKNKDFAYIYDMIVKPSLELTDTNLKQAKLERNIFAGELKRLINFAVLSENKDDCLNQMEELCYNLDIDVYDLANKELEKYNN